MMFFSTGNFNGNISSWDVSSGQDFSMMFGYTSKFNGDVSGWNISSGKNFHNMFNNAENFNQDLCSWNSKVSLDDAFTSDMFAVSVV